MRACPASTKWILWTIVVGGSVLVAFQAVPRLHCNLGIGVSRRQAFTEKVILTTTASLVNGKDSRCYNEERAREHYRGVVPTSSFDQHLPVHLSGPELDEEAIKRHRLNFSGVEVPVPRNMERQRSMHDLYPCGVPVFLNRQKPVVALASTPGSGNTWLRYLLEQLTGVRTGSIYVDRSLYRAGFVGENVSNASVLVVKSHTGTVPLRPWYDRSWMDAVILLIRDPYNATLSEFHRRKTGSHLSTAKLASFRQEFWGDLAVQMSYRFCDIIHAWLSWNRPTLIIFFEDLLVHTERELRRILNFLRVRVSPRRWQCALKHKEGFFHRKSATLSTTPFNKTLQVHMEDSLKRTSWILPEVFVRYSRTDKNG